MSGGESMQPRYDPHGVEERWQQAWEGEGLYNADPDPSRTPYVDAHPPPNVTGELHTGHALQLAVGDTVIRLKRMQGFNALFQPGYDHAGISTQNVVEKVLIAEGTSRVELGREKFEERVWEWLHEYGGKILNQFRRMGASLDYRRTRFTMDENYVRAVMRFFVHLYGRGWIYRANRIINWCPYHETSLSDLELEHEDVDDTLSTIRYPLADGDGYIAIATVRPATIPADVAVAVHPEDERYKHLIGREVIVPWTENRVPVIADERVELRLRHRRAEDHARPRPDRLPDRPRPRPARAELHRPRRPRHRRRARGADAEGGRGEDPRLVQGARPPREARALPPQRRVLRALPLAHRAADLAAVVVLDGGDQAAAARGAACARGALPPGEPAPLRDRLARERAGLVHLAADLVGPSAAGLVLPGRPHHRRGDRAERVRRVRRRRSSRARPTCSTRGSARRSGRSRRSAGPTRPTTSRTSIRATCRRPRARSSASGRTG